MGRSSQSLYEKFEARVHIVPFSSCHYWAGQITSLGYGVIVDSDKTRHLAHRLSYEKNVGPIPVINGKSAVIRHKCDNPICVNPDHLLPGTQADNMRDAAERNRMRSGERSPRAKLTDAQTQQIIEAIKLGATNKDLAATFGVAESWISTIRHGGKKGNNLPKPTGRHDRRISDEVARRVYKMARSGGFSRALIAKLCGVTEYMVSDIKRGATYASVTGHGGA